MTTTNWSIGWSQCVMPLTSLAVLPPSSTIASARIKLWKSFDLVQSCHCFFANVRKLQCSHKIRSSERYSNKDNSGRRVWRNWGGETLVPGRPKERLATLESNRWQYHARVMLAPAHATTCHCQLCPSLSNNRPPNDCCSDHFALSSLPLQYPWTQRNEIT